VIPIETASGFGSGTDGCVHHPFAGYAIDHPTDVVFFGPTAVVFVGAVEGDGCFGDVGDRNPQSSVGAEAIDPALREVEG
jgi:hypothetical protein